MSKQITRRPTKQVRRQERREEQLRREAERLRAARNRKIVLGSIIAAIVIIVAASVFYYVYNQNQGQNQNQTETVVNPSYPPVDNIYCDELEQSAYHVVRWSQLLRELALPLLNRDKVFLATTGCIRMIVLE